MARENGGGRLGGGGTACLPGPLALALVRPRPPNLHRSIEPFSAALSKHMRSLGQLG